MKITLEELEQRTRRMALILSNILHIPVEEILKYTEEEEKESSMEKFIDPMANERIKEFNKPEEQEPEEPPVEDPPPQEPPPEEEVEEPVEDEEPIDENNNEDNNQDNEEPPNEEEPPKDLP